MLTNQIKEDMSISYLMAVCAYAGISYEIIRHDDKSTDAILMKRVCLENDECVDVQLRIQLKCTSSVSQYTDMGDWILYRLKTKNYNDLCTRSTIPIILGLLILPEDAKNWLEWSVEELLLRGCMYWGHFAGCEKRNNGSTVTVRIKKTWVINNETLNNIFERLAKEGVYD